MTEIENFHEQSIREYAREQREEELSRYRKVDTTEKKVFFIETRLPGVTFDELAEILPSGENGEIDQTSLDNTFAIASFLRRRLKDSAFPEVLRKEAEAFEGKSAIGMLQEGRAEEVLGSYAEVFDWSRST